MTLGTSSVAVAVFEDEEDAVAAVAAAGVVVASLKRDLVRLVSTLRVAATGIGRLLRS